MRPNMLIPSYYPHETGRRAVSLPARLRSWVRPRTLLHLAVRAVTLASAHALFKQHARAWEQATAASLAHADGGLFPPPPLSGEALRSGVASIGTHPDPALGQSHVTDQRSAMVNGRTVPAATAWRGVAGLAVHRREAPNRARPAVGLLRAGEPVQVARWVSGEAVEPHNDTWAELADGTYVYATMLRRPGEVTPPEPPTAAPSIGRWVDVNLTEQIATAYDGQYVVRTALISSRRPDGEIPKGTFSVLRRVERDTMDGAARVGPAPTNSGRRVPNGARVSCTVENVRFVQYFTAEGAAIHENYWRRPATFGIPGNHGCIGVAPVDAAWFWEFATVGTPLLVHN